MAINSKFEYLNSKQIRNSNFQNFKQRCLENWDLGLRICFGFRISDFGFLLVFLLFLFVPFAKGADEFHGEGPNPLFYKGNHLYQQAKYDEAIASYNQILEQGIESGPLYYNLGNSYFKKGELGRAILNYERARSLAPGDSDLKSNYEYARSLIKGSPSEGRENILFMALKGPFGLLSIDGLALFLILLNSLLVASLALNIFFKPSRGYSVYLIALFGIAFVAGLVVFSERMGHLDKDAIIVGAETEARFEPLDNSTTYFSLSEGMKVEILTSQEGYSKIRRPDGKMGWVRRTALEPI